MSSRKAVGRPPRTTNKPRLGNSKKVATPLRQLPGAAVEKTAPVSGAQLDADVVELVRAIGAMIDAARKQVSVTANAALTGLYWQIGQRVHTEVLEELRAEYGAQIVSAAGRQLEARLRLVVALQGIEPHPTRRAPAVQGR